jgi:hypothetical protein
VQLARGTIVQLERARAISARDEDFAAFLQHEGKFNLSDDERRIRVHEDGIRLISGLTLGRVN